MGMDGNGAKAQQSRARGGRRFQKGHTLGGRPKGSRDKPETVLGRKQRALVKQLATEEALKYLTTHYLKRAVDAFGMLATGQGPKGGPLPPWVLRVNVSTLHKFVDKVIPDAPRQVDLGVTATMEDFLEEVMSGEYDDEEEEEAEIVPAQIEDKSGGDDGSS